MISVITASYNLAEFVGQAIFSLKCQDYDNWESIIVDDCSSDNSCQVIRDAIGDDPRFTFYAKDKNTGVSNTRNFGISKAKGEYILVLDADDLLHPQALRRYAEYWERNPDAALIVPMIHRFGNGMNNIQSRQWKGYESLKRACSPTMSSSFKKSDWERVGGFRSGTGYEDWEFWLRLLYKNDKVINIPEVIVEYRCRNNGRLADALTRHYQEVKIIHDMNPEIFGGQ